MISSQKGSVLLWVIIIAMLGAGGAFLLTRPRLEEAKSELSGAVDEQLTVIGDDEDEAPVATTAKPTSGSAGQAGTTQGTTGGGTSGATGSVGTNEPAKEPASTVEEPAPTEQMVSYTADGGFSPKTLTIASSDTKVIFKNEGTSLMWVASDHHPSHTIFPSFDQREAVPKGGVYTFTFPTTAGTYAYHNHASAGDKGSIIVK